MQKYSNKILNIIIIFLIFAFTAAACIKLLGIYGILLLLIPAAICILGQKVFMYKRKISDIFSDCFIAFFLFWAFIHSAILSKVSGINSPRRGAALAIFSASLLLLCFFSYSKKNAAHHIKSKVNIPFLICLLVSVLLRVVQFSVEPIFDAEEYYAALAKACTSFDFFLKEFFNSFVFFGHPTVGYAAILAIGEYIFPGKYIGIYIVNLLITIYFMYCVYRLFIKWFSGITHLSAAVFTLAVMCTPLFLGTFSYIHVDYGIAIFFLYFVYCISKEKYFQGVFWGIICLYTKETSIILFLGYILGIYLYDFCSAKGNIIHRLKCVFNKVNLIALIPLASETVYLILTRIGYIAVWNPTTINTGDSAITFSLHASKDMLNTFGISKDYILYKLYQIFVCDGHWIVSLISLLGICILIKKRKFLFNKDQVGILFAYLSILFFSCMYITFSLMRYNVIIENMQIIVCIVILYNALDKALLKNICMTLIIIFTGIQAFIPIDPVTKRYSQFVNTGKQPLFFLCNNTDWLGDPLVYNFQYTYLNDVINEFLIYCNYSSETYLVLPDSHYTFWPAGRFNTFSWDKYTQRRYYYGYNINQAISINYIYMSDLLNMQELPKLIYSLYLPIYGENNIESLEAEYTISEEHYWSNIYGEAIFYKLEK